MNRYPYVRAILFDLDGVLLSTDEYHYLSWKAIADRLGIPFTKADNEDLRGVGRRESLERILSGTERQLTEREKEELTEQKNTRYRTYLRSLTPEDVSPEVTGTLGALRRRGYLLAVASSSRNAKLILTLTGLSACFDAVADGNDVRASKPDPEVFLKAARFLSVPPEECAVIEDAAAGLAAARAAGMLPVAVPGAGGTDCAERLSSFADLLNLFPAYQPDKTV